MLKTTKSIVSIARLKKNKNRINIDGIIDHNKIINQKKFIQKN